MKIAMLGDGVTGSAVIKKISALPDHQICAIENADVIVVSPGIPPEQFPITNKPIISEIELAFRLLQGTRQPPKIIGITGTNGKTTITMMIGHILECPVAGNIGQPLISFVPENDIETANLPEYIALELSSYQLETTHTLKPVVSIITNITEDHLTRHKTMHNYARIKGRIFANQDINDLFIYNDQDELILDLLPDCQAAKQGFNINDDPLDIKSHLNIPGIHNLENALTAAYTANFLGIPRQTIQKKINTFQGVEHRIEYVETINQIACYNDSKGTNPESTIIAIKALGGPGILILGGKDKLTSLTQLCLHIKNNISQTILIGEAAERFKDTLTAEGYTSINIEPDMETAIKKGLHLANGEKYLLLSPACASFDMYKNFEERGAHFKNIIKEIASKI